MIVPISLVINAYRNIGFSVNRVEADIIVFQRDHDDLQFWHQFEHEGLELAFLIEDVQRTNRLVAKELTNALRDLLANIENSN